MKNPINKKIILFSILSLSLLIVNIPAIMQIESSNDPLAYNKRSGARGIMQLTAIAWKDVIYRYPRLSVYDYKKFAFNKEVNILFGKHYFQVLKQYFINSNIPVTEINLIIAYNWGIGNLIKWYRNGKIVKNLPKETKNYIQKYYQLKQ